MLQPLRDFPLLRETFDEGKAEGKADYLLQVLAQRKLAMDSRQRARIQSCQDISLLDRWFGRALVAASVDEVLAES